MSRPTTLGELIKTGWTSVPVAEEVRRNAVERIRNGDPLVAQVLGYEDTVLPQLENALLAGHDVIFLGERGQAKTRMIRNLTELLDEWMPIVSGSEINDDPLNPVSSHAKTLIADQGDDTPIDWVHRDFRYGEKLATPDTSIADLIGEVDPIKVAEGRYLSDELTLHYGLVPRSNRGIFAINELPDLSERIQVGLLNVLEERDVQIRGYKVRLPLDVMLFASANPEDYTNRGRIITPLKDRFGSQIRTHYPLDVETEMTIVLQEAVLPPADVIDVRVPEFMLEVVSEFSQQARESSQINQRSGVSVRLSVANYEAIAANAVRRSLMSGSEIAVPRIGDLAAIAATTSGKIEVEAFEDGSEGRVIDALLRSAVHTVFADSVDATLHGPIVDAFEEGITVDVGADVDTDVYLGVLAQVPALQPAIDALLEGDEIDTDEPAVVSSAIELILEGLHLAKRLNKNVHGATAQYRGRS
ncbi:MAG: sigma 54-interacting transcriptional regulator [Acidimicrobiia bacterium]|nr:sigma 54-interacting transcriptional regulator [Acidimicrobiia bacterium]